MPLLNGYKINIHVPCQHMPMVPPEWENMNKACPALADIIAYLAQAHPFARLGNYDGNFEIQIGYEGFTPRPGSDPRFGQMEKPSVLPSVTLTTFVTERVDDAKLNEFVAEIKARHPWEHPVIVITDAQIFVPENAL